MKLTLFKDQTPARVEKDFSDSILAGSPKQHAQLMYSGHNGTIKSGVWESTAGVFRADYEGIFEFCHVLEGSAVIKTSGGDVYSVEAGDGFTLDAGLQTEWTVDSYIRKHFVICQTSQD
jgi:uncharacterized cupin superfamily protein